MLRAGAQVIWTGRYDILNCRVVRIGASLEVDQKCDDGTWKSLHGDDARPIIDYVFRYWPLPVDKDFISRAVEQLRSAVGDLDELADELQFDDSGRCRVCEKLCARDRHRCRRTT